MEKYIVFIILFFIILVLTIKIEKKEKLSIDDSKSDNINNVFGKFITNIPAKMPNISVTNSLKVSEIELKRLILDYKYPVGCFYIQYPDSNTNLIKTGDILKTPFPEEKTPAKLFGGVWKDMWTNESVYFRTGTVNTSAFETVQVCTTDISNNINCNIKKTIDSRIDGFQDYALPSDLSGWTGWSQSARGDNIPRTQCKTPNAFGGCTTYGSGPSQCSGNSGVFTKCEPEKSKGCADAGSGNDKGHRNIFDSNLFLKTKYGADNYEKYISDDEVRVKNRLIKVWKRIE